MAIVRWTPARELLTLRDQMDRLMDSAWGGDWPRQGWAGPAASFPVDVYQTDREYVVRATLPGVRSEDLDVSIVGETLTIKAQLKEEENVKEDAWLLKESRATALTRTLTLPTQVQTDKVEANLDGGILTLHLPKSEALLPKTIKVNAGK